MTTSKTGWEEFFDGHAPEYMENCFVTNTLAEVEFLEEVLELTPPATILDVGCGTGRHAVELARRGFAVTGLDLSAGMLAEAEATAREAGVRVTWRKENATAFTVDEPFDAALCLCEGSFGLLGGGDDPLEQPRAILRNVAAALKPGGRCLFTVLNGYSMVRRHAPEDVASGAFDPLALTESSDCEVPNGDAPVTLRERGFVPTELRILFEEAGLEVVAMWGGTAGNWGKRAIDLDEIEIMVFARRPL